MITIPTKLGQCGNTTDLAWSLFRVLFRANKAVATNGKIMAVVDVENDFQSERDLFVHCRDLKSPCKIAKHDGLLAVNTKSKEYSTELPSQTDLFPKVNPVVAPRDDLRKSIRVSLDSRLVSDLIDALAKRNDDDSTITLFIEATSIDEQNSVIGPVRVAGRFGIGVIVPLDEHKLPENPVARFNRSVDEIDF